MVFKIHSDTAILELRNMIIENHLDFEVSKADDNRVELLAKGKDLELCVWFDVSKQLYGFNMLDGGCKKSTDIDEFKYLFESYVDINMVFIPRAKKYADDFEKRKNIISIYSHFVSDTSGAVTAVFSVLGETAKEINVKAIEGLVLVSLLQFNEDKTKVKKLSEYTYKEDSIELVPNMNYYMDGLYDKYEDNDEVGIDRIGEDLFEFKFDDILITATVEFIGVNKEIYYVVHSINGVSCEEDKKFMPPNPFDLQSLYDLIKSSMIKSVLDTAVENISEEVEVMEETSGVLDVANDFTIKRLVSLKGDTIAIRLSYPDKLYEVSLRDFNEAGIPLDRVDEADMLVKKHGVSISVEECERRLFAQNISKDDFVAILDAVFFS